MLLVEPPKVAIYPPALHNLLLCNRESERETTGKGHNNKFM